MDPAEKMSDEEQERLDALKNWLDEHARRIRLPDLLSRSLWTAPPERHLLDPVVPIHRFSKSFRDLLHPTTVPPCPVVDQASRAVATGRLTGFATASASITL